jgi:hypothetical protein
MKASTWVLDPTFPTVDGLVGSLRKKTPCEKQLFCDLPDKHAWAAMSSSSQASRSSSRRFRPRCCVLGATFLCLGRNRQPWPLGRVRSLPRPGAPRRPPQRALGAIAKSSRHPLFSAEKRNSAARRHENYCVDVHATICVPTSGVGRITGWRLVRTHAAGAARVLPRRATPRPLGASLLAAKASPDRRLLGASLLAAQNRGGRDAVP